MMALRRAVVVKRRVALERSMIHAESVIWGVVSLRCFNWGSFEQCVKLEFMM